MATPTNEVTPQWQNYVDLNSDVKPYLQIGSGANPADAQLQAVTDLACTHIQNYLGRPVAATTFFRRFSGYSGFSGSMILLPYAPVIGSPTVVEYWGTSGAHTLVEQTPAAQGGTGQEMFTLDPLRGILVRSFTGLIARPFFPGLRNVEVTWVAGYEPVPADLRYATLRLIKHVWNADQQASRTFPLPAGAREEETPVTGWFGGLPPDVERYLSQYAQVGIG